MNEIEPLIGFAVVVLFAGLVIFYSIKKIRSKYPPVFRKIKGAAKLQNAIGLTVEEGTRIHLSLGNSSLIDPSNSTALVGTSTLDRIEQLTSTSDLPPMCTSGSGAFQILSQDIAGQNTIESNSREMKNPDLTQMPGATPFAYAAGTMDAMGNSDIKANVFIGNFGAEAGLLCEKAASTHTIVVAGSDSVVAQSIFYALTEDALIGEEVYAIPAYLGVQSAHQASLRVQDIFRLLIILFLVGGVTLKILGVW